MENCITKKDNCANNKVINNEYIYSLVITFVIGFLAYGYALIVDTPVHDGIMQVTKDQIWMIQLGRWMVKYYLLIRGTMDAPVFIGMLSFIYIGTAVYFTIKILDLRFNSIIIWGVAGLYICSVAIMSLASVYTYIMDINSLALLLSVFSVYLILNKKIPYGIRICLGLFSMAMSIGLYQSYISVVVCLFLIVVIQMIVKTDDSASLIFRRGVGYVTFIVLGGLLYWVLLQVVLKVNQTELWTGGYNSVTNVFSTSIIVKLKQIPYCYWNLFKNNCSSNNPVKSELLIIANCLIVLLGLALWTKVIVEVKNKYKKILLVCLLIIFPLGVNSIYILSNTVATPLMIFSYQYLYLLCCLPVIDGEIRESLTIYNCKYFKLEYAKKIVTLCLGAVIVSSIQYSNGLAHYQRLVGIGTQTIVTNIIYDLEREYGFTGNIIILGDVSSLGGNYVLNEKYDYLSGTEGKGITITYNDYLLRYLYYMHGKKYNLVSDPEVINDYSNRQIVRDMPIYPTRGYCQTIDDYTIIKLENQCD